MNYIGFSKCVLHRLFKIWYLWSQQQINLDSCDCSKIHQALTTCLCRLYYAQYVSLSSLLHSYFVATSRYVIESAYRTSTLCCHCAYGAHYTSKRDKWRSSDVCRWFTVRTHFHTHKWYKYSLIIHSASVSIYSSPCMASERQNFLIVQQFVNLQVEHAENDVGLVNIVQMRRQRMKARPRRCWSDHG